MYLEKIAILKMHIRTKLFHVRIIENINCICRCPESIPNINSKQI